jgi:hypothetical protein
MDLPIVSDKELSELDRLIAGLKDGSVSAQDVDQKLHALATGNDHFQTLADRVGKLVDQLKKAAEAVGILKAKLDSASPALRRQAEDSSMAAYSDAADATDKYLAEAHRLNSLTKDQIALENELKKVRDDAAKAGITLSKKQAEALAKENLAADKRRSTEDQANQYDKLSKRITAATAAQNAENDALAKANPLIEDYGYHLAKAHAESELLTAAQEAGLEITPELRAEIEKLAGDYANATAAGNQLNDVQDRMRAEAEKSADIIKDAFTDIADILSSTGDTGEKLIGIFADIGKQFARMGLEKIFNYATGKSSSLFGDMPTFGGGNSVANARVSGKAIGETISPPITKSLNDNLDSYAAAIRKIESGSYEGNYGAVNSSSGATGAYQVMPGNIAAWTKEVTGVAMTQKDFLNDRAAQDKVFYAKFGQALDKYGNVSDAMAVWFSGGPLAANANRSDGSNTTAQYVSKAVSALDNYPGTLKTSVADGVVDANRRIVNSANSGRFSDGFDTSAPKSVASGGNGFQDLFSVGGATIGAFAGGYQSGSPAMGAISGALGGIGAASSIGSLLSIGPLAATGIGAIVGGIVGFALGGSTSHSKRMAHVST